MSLIFVDVEADFNSPCPGIGDGMTEFGAVEFASLCEGNPKMFHGLPQEPYDPDRWPNNKWYVTMVRFDDWLRQFEGSPIFVSDNPAYDWQWINYWFHATIKRNPFGFSARRIGDFYAGLQNDFRKASRWKHLRKTKHDHNPVNDALGNAEAFARMLKGER